MASAFDIIATIGVVPVIAIEDAKNAIALADALLEGGLPVAEITFRTAAAAEVITMLSAERPELIVGAGTILDRASVTAAIRSGATFGLAPGFDPDVVDAAADAGLPFAAGVMTPSDISAATARGARLLKFFPAGPAGGPAMLQAIAAPFAHFKVTFIPTGGATLDTLGEWLSLKSMAAVGGTWIARSPDIAAGRFDVIKANARAAVDRARQYLEQRT